MPVQYVQPDYNQPIQTASSATLPSYGPSITNGPSGASTAVPGKRFYPAGPYIKYGEPFVIGAKGNTSAPLQGSQLLLAVNTDTTGQVSNGGFFVTIRYTGEWCSGPAAV